MNRKYLAASEDFVLAILTGLLYDIQTGCHAELMEAINGDLRDRFDLENLSCTKGEFNDEGLPIGLNSIGDLHFIGCIAGGDWEIPVFFIVYIDDKKHPRAFVPKVGNAIDATTGRAYSEEDYQGDFGELNEEFVYDADAMRRQIIKRFGLEDSVKEEQ